MLDALGLDHYDDLVSAALLALGSPPFTAAQVQGALLTAKLPPSSVSDVMDVLSEPDGEKQVKLAASLKAKAAAKPNPIPAVSFRSVSLFITLAASCLSLCFHLLYTLLRFQGSQPLLCLRNS